MSYAPLKRSLLILMMFVNAALYAQESQKESTIDGNELIQYLRSNGIVYGSIMRDDSGSEIRRESYVRNSDGTVIEIITKWPDGSIARIGVFGDFQWMDYPEGIKIFRVYTPDGSIRIEERREEGVVLQRATYSYQDNSPRIASILYELPGEKTWEKLEYNLQELLIRDFRFNADEPSETLLYSYDDQGRVVEIREMTNRKETKTRFIYGEDGVQTEERIDATGALVLRITKKADGIVIEEHFDAGKLFARIFIQDGRKIREEIVSDGKVLRVREVL